MIAASTFSCPRIDAPPVTDAPATSLHRGQMKNALSFFCAMLVRLFQFDRRSSYHAGRELHSGAGIGPAKGSLD